MTRGMHIGYISIITIALVTGVASLLRDNFHTPKYQVGDCVAYVYQATEHTPRHTAAFVERVEEVGNVYYLLSSLVLGVTDDQKILYVDEKYEKVDCK